ncbi:MAG TPA: hypothetical protein VNF49_05380 [Candidatus Binataceae bacterium]|nr:hypothetical protein [Candidatus Binataceae bacterium]
MRIRVDPSIGPATAHLFDRARDVLATGSLHAEALEDFYRAQNIPQTARRFWFTRFDGANGAFIDSLERHPSYDCFEFFCQFEKNDRAFLLADREIVDKHPLYPLRYTLRNLGLFFFSPGYAHGTFGLTCDSFNPQRVPFPPLEPDVATARLDAFVPELGRAELLRPAPHLIASLRQRLGPLLIAWKESYRVANRILLTRTLVALATLFRGPRDLRAPAAIAWLCILYDAVITLSLHDPPGPMYGCRARDDDAWLDCGPVRCRSGARSGLLVERRSVGSDCNCGGARVGAIVARLVTAGIWRWPPA